MHSRSTTVEESTAEVSLDWAWAGAGVQAPKAAGIRVRATTIRVSRVVIGSASVAGFGLDFDPLCLIRIRVVLASGRRELPV
jgi:hypothetical protein